MRFFTVSELRQQATKIISEIEKSKEEVIITKNGKPVVLMRFITEDIFKLKENGNGKGKESDHGKVKGNI